MTWLCRVIGHRRTGRSVAIRLMGEVIWQTRCTRCHRLVKVN